LQSQQQAPLTFTQQLQRQSKLSSRNNLMVNSKHASSSGAAGHKSSGGGGGAKLPDNHFARDTHMRIILGNLKENQPSSSG